MILFYFKSRCFNPKHKNVVDEEHFSKHTYENRFCNSLKKPNYEFIQTDSFFVNGKPGNLARIFASIAGSINCNCHKKNKVNKKVKSIVQIDT